MRSGENLKAVCSGLSSGTSKEGKGNFVNSGFSHLQLKGRDTGTIKSSERTPVGGAQTFVAVVNRGCWQRPWKRRGEFLFTLQK